MTGDGRLSLLPAQITNLKYVRLNDVDYRLRSIRPAILPARWLGGRGDHKCNLGVPLALAFDWLVAHTLCLLTHHRGICENPYGETVCVDCGRWLSYVEADRASVYVEGW